MSRYVIRPWRTVTGLVASGLMIAATVGCSPSSSEVTASEAGSVDVDVSPLTVRDPWVKAADEGMTAAFGVLVNDGDTDVTVVSADSPVSPMEIHEIVMADGEMLMREKEEGLTVPAGGSHTLEPGGDHLMLMDLAAPIAPGDEVAITLTLADGATVEFTAVAKPFAGGEERYEHDHDDHHDEHDDEQ